MAADGAVGGTGGAATGAPHEAQNFPDPRSCAPHFEQSGMREISHAARDPFNDALRR
jgi:hypothetical protein